MQKVLIAEKDPSMREYYAQLIQSLGHTALTCHDGISVLDCASANPEIDLILMDLDLPGTWGQQLVEVLRGIDHLADVPIIVVSARRTRTELMRLLVIGVRQCFEKPPEQEVLISAIQSSLDRSAALDLFDVEDFVPVPVGAGASSEVSWLLHA